MCFYQLSDSIKFKIKFNFPVMSARNANVKDRDVIEFGGHSWWVDPRHFM